MCLSGRDSLSAERGEEEGDDGRGMTNCGVADLAARSRQSVPITPSTMFHPIHPSTTIS